MERIVDGIVVEPPAPIERMLVTRLQWILGADAEYLHDGDAQCLGADPDPNARFRAGQPVPIETSEIAGTDLDWANSWIAAHDHRKLPFYTPTSSFTYRLCVFLNLERVQAAMKRGEEVPMLGLFMCKAAELIRAAALVDQPHLFVPSPAEARDSEFETPTGAGTILNSDQKRTLGWLVNLERDRAARMLWIRQPPRTATEEDQQQWKWFGAHDLQPVVQIGPTGPNFNMSPRIDYWSKTRDLLVDYILVLALVQVNPFRLVCNIPWAHPRDRDRYLVSRVTLVVVPADRIAHWIEEAHRVLPATARIVQLTSEQDHKTVAWNDVLLADLVLVSISFRPSLEYRRRVTRLVGSVAYLYSADALKEPAVIRTVEYDLVEHLASMGSYAIGDMSATAFVRQLDLHMYNLIHRRGRADFGRDKHAVILDRVHFHRLVVNVYEIPDPSLPRHKQTQIEWAKSNGPM
ncbi:hypothetical protein GGF32_006346 [Allomyces javanicus]|nr:hypothetical protein GGF32_006346 [Allomyces javanicus]